MAELQARILVVDDEARNVKLMEAILAPRGYTVVQAYNGEEALQQVQWQRPDLILLDVLRLTTEGMADQVTKIACGLPNLRVSSRHPVAAFTLLSLASSG